MPPTFSAFLAVHILGELFGRKVQTVDTQLDISRSLGPSFSRLIPALKAGYRENSLPEPDRVAMGYRAIDLFCGAGGLSQGLLDAGFEVVAAVDTWKPAIASYKANFPLHPVLDVDIATLSKKSLESVGAYGGIDLVAGGPPCQGFSHQRIGSDLDNRNDLVLAFGSAVLLTRSRFFPYGETFTGLLGARGRVTVQKFLQQMRGGGYEVRHAVLDAADFGVPQNRQRVFFVGWQADQRAAFEFPMPFRC